MSMPREIGRPNQGAAAELRGERVRTYPTEILANSAPEIFEAFRFDAPGLPAGYFSLYAGTRTAFVPKGERVVAHGGISVEGDPVPFVKILTSEMINPTPPQIGFDRFIKLEWAIAALRVRAGFADMPELAALIEASHKGEAAKKKTRTVLNRLWLEPRPDLVEFADRGAELWREDPDTPASVLNWGMAIATYPFFGKVAEIVGRLTAIQGDCASAEVHRRMSEIYGEREGTKRMTNMVLQSQASWGALKRYEKGKRLARMEQVDIARNGVKAWLVEACLRYAFRELPVTSLSTNLVIYPFSLGENILYELTRASNLDVRADNTGRHLVSLRA